MMLKKALRLRNLGLYLRVCSLQQTVGVNSTLGDGEHIIMWDFDQGTEVEVYSALWNTIRHYGLPQAHMVQSSPGRWQGYCLVALPWEKVVGVVASTPLVDLVWLAHCILRGYLTLRVGVKDGHLPRAYAVIASPARETVKREQLRNLVCYYVEG